MQGARTSGQRGQTDCALDMDSALGRHDVNAASGAAATEVLEHRTRLEGTQGAGGQIVPELPTMGY